MSHFSRWKILLNSMRSSKKAQLNGMSLYVYNILWCYELVTQHNLEESIIQENDRYNISNFDVFTGFLSLREVSWGQNVLQTCLGKGGGEHIALNKCLEDRLEYAIKVEVLSQFIISPTFLTGQHMTTFLRFAL